MNKKQIMAGVLAGGLLLTVTTASAETNASNSKTTSEAKTSIQWKSLKINSKELAWSDKASDKLLQEVNINKDLIVANLAKIIKAEAEKKHEATQQVEKDSKETTKEVTQPKDVKKEEVAAPKAEAKEEVATPKAEAKEEVAAPKAEAKEEVAVPKAEAKEEVTAPKAEAKEEAATTPQPTQQAQATEKTETNTNSEKAQVSTVIQQVVDLTNAERAKEGLAPLKIDSALTKSAQLKSQDMKDNNYFSHTSPTYGSPFDQMKSLGINYKSAAENIAMGQRSAEEVVQGWMNSAGHRANIMNGSYTHIGVGLSDSGYYWTQQFISK
ncbi:CAP domain-containing protein [Psychrobacillus sp. FSL K6-2684]|uniref:CAP domain-containing protein n=1 Tax=Psychrobacillus sp. FSL K6-2684 TaxID=2921547 RepID=UPI0030FC2E14